jgi:hypothetical protein
MVIIKIVIWAVAIYMLIGWITGTRGNIKKGLRVMNATAVSGMLISISILAVLILRLSSYHFIWMLPASMLMGTFSLLFFPFSLLRGLGEIFGKICCIGLDMNQARQNHERMALLSEIIRELRIDPKLEEEIVKRIVELIKSGTDPDEIKKIIRNERT